MKHFAPTERQFFKKKVKRGALSSARVHERMYTQPVATQFFPKQICTRVHDEEEDREKREKSAGIQV